jgi:DnaK suppressor protein
MVIPLPSPATTAGGHFPRNPKGRACFCAVRRFSSLIWNNQTALLLPCLAQKQATAQPRMKWQQT